MISSNPSPSGIRKLVFTLFIVLAAGHVAGRILSVSRVYEPDLSRPPDKVDDPRGLWPKVRPEPMPTHGDNDRSRWDTVRALVDNGTYAIGDRDPGRITAENKYGDGGIISEDGWKTIDKVLDPETHKFYSSKPPFLPTLLAGEYWFLKKTFGWSITEQRFLVMRTILLTVNLLPFVIFLVLLARLADKLGATDWGRIYIVACGCFATLMIPFATTLNNHTIAACSAMFALYAALRILATHQNRGSKIEDGGLKTQAGAAEKDVRSSILNRPPSFPLYGFFAVF